MCGYERAAGFLSTLSLRRATALSATSKTSTRHFYPRSPCGERRKFGFTHTAQELFLSTLSLRRATLRRSASIWLERYFYPRSPCGERLCTPHSAAPWQGISIHALLAESDQRCPALPTSAPGISIHALLAESDSFFGRFAVDPSYFYPRSPCGERQKLIDKSCQFNGFLSTLSLRRATDWPPVRDVIQWISIHALLAESDVFSFCFSVFDFLFLSTLSLRRATAL